MEKLAEEPSRVNANQIVRDVAQPPHPPVASAAADDRETAAASLDDLAGSTTHPVSAAIGALARFTRAEWPESSELPDLVKTAEALARLESSSSDTLDEAVSHAAQAEAARASASAVLQQMIAAVDAPPSSELAALRDRVSSLESLMLNATTRGDRLAADLLSLRRETADARARQAAAEAEREGVQRRLDALEFSVGHLHKILEAAQAFAAESPEGQAQS